MPLQGFLPGPSRFGITDYSFFPRNAHHSPLTGTVFLIFFIHRNGCPESLGETFASCHFEKREQREILMMAVSERFLPSVEMTRRTAERSKQAVEQGSLGNAVSWYNPDTLSKSCRFLYRISRLCQDLYRDITATGGRLQ